MTYTFNERAARLPYDMGNKLKWLKFYIQWILFIFPIVGLIFLVIGLTFTCMPYQFSDVERSLYTPIYIISAIECIVRIGMHSYVKDAESIQAYNVLIFSFFVPLIFSFIFYVVQLGVYQDLVYSSEALHTISATLSSQFFGTLIGGGIFISLNIVYIRKRKGLFDGTAFTQSAPCKMSASPYTTVTPSNSKFELNIPVHSTEYHQTENNMPQNQAWTANVAYEDNSTPTIQTIEPHEIHTEEIPQHNKETDKAKTECIPTLERILVDTVMKSIDIVQGKLSFTDAQKAETAVFAKTLFYQYVSRDITAHSIAFARLVKNLKQESDMPEDVIANIMRMREAEYMKLISTEGIEAMVSAYINDIADLGGNSFNKEEFDARVRSFVKEVQA